MAQMRLTSQKMGQSRWVLYLLRNMMFLGKYNVISLLFQYNGCEIKQNRRIQLGREAKPRCTQRYNVCDNICQMLEFL